MPTKNLILDPKTIAKLQGLELRARHLIDGYLAGMHRSSLRGHSAEFAEHREYAPGDDLRYVDWKVFGKTDKVYLKQFEAETNLVCYLAVDVSESMRYQSQPEGLSKKEYAQCLAAALAHIVLRQRDSVSLATFDERLDTLVGESSNPTHWSRLVHVLEQAKSTGRSEIGGALHELAGRLGRRGVVVLLSDLLGDVESLLSGLKHLRYQRHEVIVLQLLDPAELEFPFRRTTLFRGMEGLPEVVAQPRGIRKAYLAAMQDFLERVQSGCRSLQVEYSQVSTDQPLDVALKRLLVGRSANSWRR